MASKDLICFDASIRNGIIGIGVWNRTKQDKIFKSYPAYKHSPLVAERIALITALQYIKENGIERAHLFTDNMSLFKEGISDKIYKKYINDCKKKIDVELFWIPREFNKEADRLSKQGSEVSKVNIATLQHTGEFNIKVAIKNYSIKKRLDLLKRMALTKYQIEYIDFIQTPCASKFQQSKHQDDKTFVNFACAIFNADELQGIKKTKIQKGKTKFCSSKIERFIRTRNLI